MRHTSTSAQATHEDGRRFPWGAIGVVAFLVSIVALVYALPRGKDPFTPTGSTVRFVGLDASGSAEADWKHYCPYAGRLAASLNPETDEIHMFRFERECQSFPTQIPKDPDVLSAKLWEEFQALKKRRSHEPKEKQKGTRPALFLEAVADTLRALNDSRPVEVFLFWDGGDDYLHFQGYDKVFAEAVRELAGNPRVQRVVVWGVHSNNYDTVKKRLRAFGDRLEVFRNDEELELKRLITATPAGA